MADPQQRRLNRINNRLDVIRPRSIRARILTRRTQIIARRGIGSDSPCAARPSTPRKGSTCPCCAAHHHPCTKPDTDTPTTPTDPETPTEPETPTDD